jgi:ribonuclease HI
MDDAGPIAHWKRMRFKRNKVWVPVDQNQTPLVQNGKVVIKYQLDQPHQYRVRADSLRLIEETTAQIALAPSPTSAPCHPPHDPAAIAIYTDGACSGNPGPGGIGVVMVYKGHHKEIARHIGEVTNNIAELEAVRIALEAVKNRHLPVVIHTDSRYVWGVLSQGWKAEQNRALIEKIRSLMNHFHDIRFIKIQGHAGHPENERADHLAVGAIKGSATQNDLKPRP